MPTHDFTLTDQAGQAWNLEEHLEEAAYALLFLRGDW